MYAGKLGAISRLRSDAGAAPRYGRDDIQRQRAGGIGAGLEAFRAGTESHGHGPGFDGHRSSGPL